MRYNIHVFIHPLGQGSYLLIKTEKINDMKYAKITVISETQNYIFCHIWCYQFPLHVVLDGLNENTTYPVSPGIAECPPFSISALFCKDISIIICD